ncbi:putative MFS sugar transporter [Aspergillus lucknowensis]|uniref:MFS sugar transporter n=1 Tax=Aspergillus lucknowensis TaxID=176173 RepID=A0ABR4LKM9_9EURO
MAGSETTQLFSQYRNNTHKTWWKDPCLRWNVFHCVCLYWAVFYLGYDASLLNGLQALPQWTGYFNDPSSNDLGLISASLFLPAIVTPYFCSAVNAKWGRKIALATGSILLICGAFVNAFATNRGMFIAGRVLMGYAAGLDFITAIALLQEIAHPRLRAVLSCSFYSNYYVGSVVAAWFCYGSLSWGPTNWAWRAPCLFQIVAPTLLLLALFSIPESPRWLIHHDQTERALAILAKYHANGDQTDELVSYEYKEICHAIQLEEENSKTSFRDFLRTPGNRRRLLVLITMATGTNWVGNGIITYYLTPVLNLAGITNPRDISGINGGLAAWNLILAYIGSFSADRFGRRTLWLVSTIGMLATYIIFTGLSGGFASTQSKATGIAIVPMLFIYYGFYDFGWTPLPFSYGAEILPYHMRLKGLSIMLSVQSVAQAFNQWVNPIALDNIQWKYYIVYIVLLCIYLTIVWFFFPETSKLTIEEVSVIFDTGRMGSAAAVAAEFSRDMHKGLDREDGDKKVDGEVKHVEDKASA